MADGSWAEGKEEASGPNPRGSASCQGCHRGWPGAGAGGTSEPRRAGLHRERQEPEPGSPDGPAMPAVEGQQWQGEVGGCSGCWRALPHLGSFVWGIEILI